MDKICLIYVDFDDTLYCHKNHWSYGRDFEYNMKFGFNKLTYDAKYLNFELIEKLKQIKNINEQRNIKTIICLLTGCRTSVYFKAKTDFISKLEPDLFNQYFSVASQEEKLPMILAFNEELSKNYKIANILVIDDGYGVLCVCQDEDIEAVTPEFFEKHYEFE